MCWINKIRKRLTLAEWEKEVWLRWRISNPGSCCHQRDVRKLPARPPHLLQRPAVIRWRAKNSLRSQSSV